MVTQIHTLRNLMTTARLTTGAMLDGLLPLDAKNLRELAETLDNANGLLAKLPKYVFDPAATDDAIVDVDEMLRSVADEVALVSAATDVAVIVVVPAPADSGCRVMRGNRRAVYAAFEGALRALLTMLPAGSAVTVVPRSAAIITLTVTLPGGEPASLAAHVAEMAAHLEPHRGKIHPGHMPGEYCLHLPGEHLCSGAAARADRCRGEN
jgi:hypothetical protein